MNGPPRRPYAAIHALVHPDEKSFHCPTCRRRHRVDEDCLSNPEAMEINADDHDLARVTQHAFEALMISSAERRTHFRFAGEIVRLTSDEGGRLRVESMHFTRLRHTMSTAAQWVVTSKPPAGMASGTKRPVEPPRAVIENMLATPIEAVPLPVLRGIVQAPVFAADGRLVDTPGFHAASGLLYAPAADLEVPGIPAEPSAKDVSRARELLETELIGDFPFKAVSDKAAAVGTLILPFVRDLIAGPTPILAIEKPTIGTGGSLLADLLTYPARGTSLPPMNAPKNEDEMRKKITAALLGSPTHLLFDNVSGRLNSESLAAVVTSSYYEDRRLGRTETVRVPVRCGWLVTGNNPVYSPELIRRIVRCRLDAGVDRPWLRSPDGFRHPDICRWAADHRADIIWAALVLVKAWIVAGRPDGRRSLGSFESWARVVGGIFDVVGVPGFLENILEFYDEADAETSAWREFVAAWSVRYGDREVATADLWPLVNPTDADPIDIGIRDGTERSQKTQLGKLLHARRDQRFGDHQLTTSKKRQGAQLWRLRRCAP